MKAAAAGRVIGVVTGFGLAIGMATAQAACPPAGWDVAALMQLRIARFDLPDPARRAALAEGLVDCLDHPEPRLRDEIAFDALSTWLRAGALAPAQLPALRDALLARLRGDDPSGFGRPFAALTLAELARVDRLRPWLDAPGRAAMLAAAVAYQRGVVDYRGFDAVQGWRHGVAHGADWLLQLALNPAIDRDGLAQILSAVASQVAPPGAPPYVHGESERLARPVFYAARRGLLDAEFWNAWLAASTRPAPLPDWPGAFRSSDGLARLHNIRAFVQTLYVMVHEGGDAALIGRLQPALHAALNALP